MHPCKRLQDESTEGDDALSVGLSYLKISSLQVARGLDQRAPILGSCLVKIVTPIDIYTWLASGKKNRDPLREIEKPQSSGARIIMNSRISPLASPASFEYSHTRSHASVMSLDLGLGHAAGEAAIRKLPPDSDTNYKRKRVLLASTRARNWTCYS